MERWSDGQNLPTLGLLAHLLRFGGWGGCQGGLTTECEDMGQQGKNHIIVLPYCLLATQTPVFLHSLLRQVHSALQIQLLAIPIHQIVH